MTKNRNESLRFQNHAVPKSLQIYISIFRKKIGTAQFWNRNDLFLILVIRKRNAEDEGKFSFKISRLISRFIYLEIVSTGQTLTVPSSNNHY